MFAVAELLFRLSQRLSEPLPGEAIQNQMSPVRAYSTKDFLLKNPDHKKSAVLVLLWPESDHLRCLLIQRPDYDGVHSGQIAFPGGRFEEGDKNLLATAIRETYEEIGFQLELVQVAGALSPLYIPVSNYLVQPFIGIINKRPECLPDKREVRAVLDFSLDNILKTENIKVKERILFSGVKVKTPYYEIEGFEVWGATAMILSEFSAVLQKIISS